MNVAYHLARQGLAVAPVTAVGRDFLGDEALRRIETWGVNTEGIARVAGRPTGFVRAVIDAAGVASYDIASGVAWDRIPVPARLVKADRVPGAIVFGTLALREKPNRETLQTLCAKWPGALRVVDLNFRSPFDSTAVVKLAMRLGELIKLNEHELAQLNQTRRRGDPAALERGARKLAADYDLARICVTAGERGAGLLWDGEWFWEDARPVAVRDTVGAGDAFLGGLLGALLKRGGSPRKALEQACRLGEFVASQDGATPHYDVRKVTG